MAKFTIKAKKSNIKANLIPLLKLIKINETKRTVKERH